MAANTAFMILWSKRTDRYKSKDCEWTLDYDGPYATRDELNNAIRRMLTYVPSFTLDTPEGWTEIGNRTNYKNIHFGRKFAITDQSLWDAPNDILTNLSKLTAGRHGIMNKYKIVEFKVPATRKRGRDAEGPGSSSSKKAKPLVATARGHDPGPVATTSDWLADLVPETWREALSPIIATPGWTELRGRLENAGEEGVYPPRAEIFAALSVEPEDVRVVILGQDPYHGPGQAHGYAFSVRDGVRAPPSLRNICTQVESEFGGTCPTNLEPWARQGVLLLNTTLTVTDGAPNSHKGWGWDEVTDAIVSIINEAYNGVVFMLWGKHAQGKGKLIDRERHLVIETPHPSPLSAHCGFFDRPQFAEANDYLGEARAIRWHDNVDMRL